MIGCINIKNKGGMSSRGILVVEKPEKYSIYIVNIRGFQVIIVAVCGSPSWIPSCFAQSRILIDLAHLASIRCLGPRHIVMKWSEHHCLGSNAAYFCQAIDQVLWYWGNSKHLLDGDDAGSNSSRVRVKVIMEGFGSVKANRGSTRIELRMFLS